MLEVVFKNNHPLFCLGSTVNFSNCIHSDSEPEIVTTAPLAEA